MYTVARFLAGFASRDEILAAGAEMNPVQDGVFDAPRPRDDGFAVDREVTGGPGQALDVASRGPRGAPELAAPGEPGEQLVVHAHDARLDQLDTVGWQRGECVGAAAIRGSHGHGDVGARCTRSGVALPRPREHVADHR